ncbi:MAG TPA: hypothetical protein PKG67_15665 [Turneriella sp.]|nr:hypothetical protein [Turneriella sp.]
MIHRQIALSILIFLSTGACRRDAARQQSNEFVQKELLRYFAPGMHPDRSVVGLWYAEKKGLASLAEAKLKRENPGVAMSRAAGELKLDSRAPEMFIRVGSNGIFRTMLILPDKVKLEFGKYKVPKDDEMENESADQFEGYLQSSNMVPVRFVVYKGGRYEKLIYYEGNNRIEAYREFAKPEDIMARYRQQFSKLQTLFPES